MAIQRTEIYRTLSPGQSELLNIQEVDDVTREIRLLDKNSVLISARPLDATERGRANDRFNKDLQQTNWLITQRDAQALAPSPERSVILGIIDRMNDRDNAGVTARIRGTSISGNVGGSDSIGIVIDKTPISGLSGFTLHADISDPTVAKFTDVVFGAAFIIASHTPDPLDGPNVEASGADVSGAIGGEQVDVLLATLAVEFLSAGVVNIALDVSALDDDNGNDIVRVVEDATISVT